MLVVVRIAIARMNQDNLGFQIHLWQLKQHQWYTVLGKAKGIVMIECTHALTRAVKHRNRVQLPSHQCQYKPEVNPLKFILA